MIKENILDKTSKVKVSKTKLNTLSFFSGALGLDIGLEKVGFNVLLACEIDKASRNTISLNKPKLGLIGDLRNYSVKEILEYSNVRSKNDVDVIVGGPPCQAFSTAGKRLGFSDKRGNVFLKYLEVIEEIKPKYFVLENVRGLMSSIFQLDEQDEISSSIPQNILSQKGSSLYYTILRLEKAGYNINFNLYNSANFGVPQSRERIVIIGTTQDEKVSTLTPTHSQNGEFGLRKWRNIKYAFKKLKNKDNSEQLKYTEKRISYYKHLKAGENWKSLSVDLQKESMGKAFYLGGGKTGFLRRLSWSKPAPTLVTSPMMPATDLCHPEEIRPLSVLEYQVIQEFPLNWKFGGTVIEKYKQIGNAVPVGLGRAIGREIIMHSKGQVFEKFIGFKHSRYLRTSYEEFVANIEKIARKQKQFKLFG